MFATLFNFLYELICGENADAPEYGDGIFSSAGLLTLFVILTVAAIFYIGLGRLSNVWHKLTHWWVTLIFSAILGFLIAFLLAKSELGLIDGYLIKFALFNAVFAIVYFALFSFLLKRFSIYAKRTPF